ncbi:hypothetical protein [Streptomyces sp. NPDC050600]|uniref:hypothetical protein n=1 Tax=Streptomyces sp. NPDC050600 TaxID=3157213 RepID=UPI00342FDFFA
MGGEAAGGGLEHAEAFAALPAGERAQVLVGQVGGAPLARQLGPEGGPGPDGPGDEEDAGGEFTEEQAVVEEPPQMGVGPAVGVVDEQQYADPVVGAKILTALGGRIGVGAVHGVHDEPARFGALGGETGGEA